jgi:predicted NBD/HSP70 family sugar kinase
VVGHLIDCVNGVIAALPGLSPEDVAVVGVSLPSHVDREDGVSIHAPNCGWHGVPFQPLVSRRSTSAGSAGQPAQPGAAGGRWVSAASGDVLLTRRRA